ncbi:hypothetical protein [Kutzneria sp. NPDC051319]|uniref:hypothetical protein n=1 Tax=Kutzneria sp. NPDC051319 TaxID=3155047 RepID=UPI00343C8DF3
MTRTNAKSPATRARRALTRGVVVLGAAGMIAAGAGTAPASAAPPRTQPVAVHCDTAHYFANYDQAADRFFGEQSDTVSRGGLMNRRIITPFEGRRGVVVFHGTGWFFTTRACLG